MCIQYRTTCASKTKVCVGLRALLPTTVSLREDLQTTAAAANAAASSAAAAAMQAPGDPSPRPTWRRSSPAPLDSAGEARGEGA